MKFPFSVLPAFSLIILIIFALMVFNTSLDIMFTSYMNILITLLLVPSLYMVLEDIKGLLAGKRSVK